MASRTGARPKGSDGNDFKHRERIADHYQESVAAKVSIKKSLIPHMFITVLGFGRILSVSMGVQYFNPPEAWELLWLISGMGAFVGFGSLQKNLNNRLLLYLITNVVFGLAPLLYGVSLIIKRCIEQYQQEISFGEWQDAPMKVAAIVVCLELQFSGLYYGYKLFNAWSAGAKKSK